MSQKSRSRGPFKKEDVKKVIKNFWNLRQSTKSIELQKVSLVDTQNVGTAC